MDGLLRLSLDLAGLVTQVPLGVRDQVLDHIDTLDRLVRDIRTTCRRPGGDRGGAGVVVAGLGVAGVGRVVGGGRCSAPGCRSPSGETGGQCFLPPLKRLNISCAFARFLGSWA